MRYRGLILLLILTFLVVGGAATGFAVAQAPGSYVKKFTVKAYRYGYSPEVLVVDQGDIVVVTIESADAVHGFYIEGYEVRKDGVSPKAAATISFVADQVGMFRIRCSSICGPLHPFMMGQLIVQPNARFIAGSLGVAALSASFVVYLWAKEEEE